MGKKIKVLSVGHSYVVALNRSILRELAKDPDFDVTVGAPDLFKGSLRSIQLEPEPIDSPLKVVPLRTILSQKMHLFSYNPSDLNQLFRQNFDCAHFWEEPYIFSGFQLGRMAKKYQIPFLFRTAQSLIKNYMFPFNIFEQQTLKAANRWVAGGHLVYQAMLEKGFEKPGQVITLAVDTEAFKPFSASQKEEVLKSLGLKGPVIGYLGRLSEEKGCDLFMDVLAQLKEYPWSFLVMGSGPYKEKIQSWARFHKLEDRVKVMLVPHQEVPKFLPVCDLLICPSQTRDFWKEQFGRMIVEAFASGVAVMGSDSGEIPRVIGEAGVVLPESDRNKWRDALQNFLENQSSFDSFKAKGLVRVKSFSAIAIAEQYKEVYRHLAHSQSLNHLQA